MQPIEHFLDRVICGDCLEVMKDIPDNSVDCVMTDPPYYDIDQPYPKCDISFLTKYSCKQIIFWSGQSLLPVDYSEIHIWDKMRGCRSKFERIFIRNTGGCSVARTFKCCPIDNKISAGFIYDIYTKHPTQKPLPLLLELVNRYTNPNDIILDPFLGS